MSNEEHDKNRLITMAEAAELYGLTPQYLSRLAKKGRLKATLFGHSYVTTPADMEEFLSSREKKGFFREDIRIALD